MEKSKETNYRKLILFLAVVCFVFAAATVYFSAQSRKLVKQQKLTKEKAVSELCENLDSISVSLQKGIYTTDGEALEAIGNELCRQGARAKDSLGQLDFDREIRDGIYRFLSQVGNYTVWLAREKDKESDRSELLKLFSYAEKLSEGLNGICLDYYNGELSFEKAAKSLAVKEELPEDFYDRLYDTAQTAGDYPTLIYDGPFSDSLVDKSSEFLKNKKEITADEAQAKAAEILGVQKSALRRGEDVDSYLKLYSFSYGENDITITKKGGYLCSFISEGFAERESISPASAIKRGEEYLKLLGYESMTSSYYSVYDGVCTINYAFEKDGVIFYSDLIKVKIGLDKGKLMGFDATAYLLGHRERNLPEAKLSLKQAEKIISSSLELIDSRYAVIPLETGKEVFCLQLHCKDKESRELLIYLNALTAKQEDILLLLYSDDGIMTK